MAKAGHDEAQMKGLYNDAAACTHMEVFELA